MAFKKKVEDKILDVDASMQGSMTFKDPVNLRINGKFEGTLEVRGNLTIGATAIVNADISGDNIIIGGRVRGRVTAKERLTLLPTAIVEGDIFPARLNAPKARFWKAIVRCCMIFSMLRNWRVTWKST